MPLRPRLGINRAKNRYCLRNLTMSSEEDLRRVEEHVAEARRIVQRQKGLIVRLRAAGVNTLDAQRILWLLESNLRRLEQHRDHLKGNVQHRGASAARLAAIPAGESPANRDAMGQRRGYCIHWR